MKLNKKDKLILISKYNLDLVSQIINNQKFRNHNIECSNFNGNLEIFLMNKKHQKMIMHLLSKIYMTFQKNLKNL